MKKPLKHTPSPSTLSREQWPPAYGEVYRWRQKQLVKMRTQENVLAGALLYYANNPVAFINHWVDTFDPRAVAKGKLSRMPLVMFQKQEELINCYMQLIENECDGLVEKSRDMGATWVSCAFSVWLWRFRPGSSVGWGSRKQDLVDRIGVVDSIFEKMRIIIRRMPQEFWPEGFDPDKHSTFMKIINPANGSVISGEAGDNIGRGGRNLIYFKDESAHYERPELIEAALGDNTRCQVDISSVNGANNVFHRRAQAGDVWEGEVLRKGKTQVIVMDWRDHPEKDQAWYDAKRAKAKDDGLLHVFAQETDRDYSASVEGIIIPAEWVRSAVDADKALNLPPPTGKKIAGLDVADEGGDLNSLASRKGYSLLSSAAWGDGDTGKTTRRSIKALLDEPCEIQYDSVGVGAGVKAEANRLADLADGDDDRLPDNLTFVPWSAGAKAQNPDKHLLKNEDGTEDKKSPTNKDFYSNLKAQAWWELRLRFERTHRAVTEGIEYDPDDLISLSSEMPGLVELMKELSQATAGRTTAGLKLQVNKAPPGTRSPNRADAVVMAYWPLATVGPVVQMFIRKKNR